MQTFPQIKIVDLYLNTVAFFINGLVPESNI